MTAAALPDWYHDTDRGLADDLVESNRLTYLATESRYREQHAEWIGRDAEGRVTQLTDNDMTALAEKLLRDRGQPLDRAADVIDYAQVIANEWVPARDRHYGEPWPGDFDEDDPVADLAGAVAYVAEQGDMSLPFTWPRLVTSGDEDDLRQSQSMATEDHLALQPWIVSSGALREDMPPINGHAAITEQEVAPMANVTELEAVATAAPEQGPTAPVIDLAGVRAHFELYRGMPGLLHVCGHGHWSGRRFTTDTAGIDGAVAYVAELDALGVPSIYARGTTIRPDTTNLRGDDDDTDHRRDFKLDIDFKSPTKVNYPADALTAIKLITEAGLPMPTTWQLTGHGIYPGWTLTEPVPHSDEAQRLQLDIYEAVRAKFAEHGFELDKGITDPSRIWRVPSTVNGKDPAALVLSEMIGVPRKSYLFAELRAGVPEVVTEVTAKAKGVRVAPEEITKFLEGLPPGPACKATRNELSKRLSALRTAGDRFPTARDAVAALLRLGEMGHRDVAAAIDDVEELFLERVVDDHDRDTDGEWNRAVGGGVRLVLSTPTLAANKGCKCGLALTGEFFKLSGGSTWTPTAVAEQAEDESEDRHQWILPADVWELSPQLQTIKQAALSRHASPDVVLHSTLAYISSSVHYRTRLETGLGPTVLNHFVIAVGGSGSGKTKSQGSARDLLDQTLTLRWAGSAPGTFIEDEIGSGEGLIEAFMGTIERTNDEGETQRFRTQVFHNAMFSADEGRTVLATAQRQGTTVLGTLCQLWSGAAAGQRNAEASRTRRLGRGSYAMGMTIGFQPDTMDDLFADKAGGAPQRFACAWATHPDHTAEYVEWPGELAVTVPKQPLTLSLPADIQQEVREQSAALARGDITLGQLDGHRQLMRCRMAALLAIMHGDAEVLHSHWELAGVLSDHSAALRDHLAGRAERQRAEEAKRKEAATVRTQVRAAVEIGDFGRVRRAADQLIRVVTKNGGSMPRGKALNTLRSDLRGLGDAAVAMAIADGTLIEEQRERGNGKTSPELIITGEPSSEG